MIFVLLTCWSGGHEQGHEHDLHLALSGAWLNIAETCAKHTRVVTCVFWKCAKHTYPALSSHPRLSACPRKGISHVWKWTNTCNQHQVDLNAGFASNLAFPKGIRRLSHPVKTHRRRMWTSRLSARTQRAPNSAILTSAVSPMVELFPMAATASLPHFEHRYALGPIHQVACRA